MACHEDSELCFHVHPEAVSKIVGAAKVIRMTQTPNNLLKFFSWTQIITNVLDVLNITFFYYDNFFNYVSVSHIFLFMIESVLSMLIA